MPSMRSLRDSSGSFMSSSMWFQGADVHMHHTVEKQRMDTTHSERGTTQTNEKIVCKGGHCHKETMTMMKPNGAAMGMPCPMCMRAMMASFLGMAPPPVPRQPHPAPDRAVPPQGARRGAARVPGAGAGDARAPLDAVGAVPADAARRLGARGPLPLRHRPPGAAPAPPQRGRRLPANAAHAGRGGLTAAQAWRPYQAMGVTPPVLARTVTLGAPPPECEAHAQCRVTL